MTELATVNAPQTNAPHLDENTRGIILAVGRNPEQGPVLSEDTRINMRLLHNRFAEYLLSGSNEWILGRVATALEHYFAGSSTEPLQAAVAIDWVNVLSKRPAWAVDRAFTQWIEDEPSKRPTPAAISKLAYTFAAKSYERRDLIEKCLSTTKHHMGQNFPNGDPKWGQADGQERDKRGRTKAEIAYGVEMFGISKWLLRGFGSGKVPSPEELAETDAEVARRVSAAKARLFEAGGPRL